MSPETDLHLFHLAPCSPPLPPAGRADSLPPAWWQKTPRGTIAISRGKSQAHTSLLAAGVAESPSTAGHPTPGTHPAPAPGTAHRLASPAISRGHPWEPTMPLKGGIAGAPGQGEGSRWVCWTPPGTGQPVPPAAAPHSGSGVFFLAISWPWGRRKGSRALCPGGCTGSVPLLQGGKGHRGGEKGAPCFGCVLEPPAVPPTPSCS